MEERENMLTLLFVLVGCLSLVYCVQGLLLVGWSLFEIVRQALFGVD